ncbi:MAG: SGNH/GDSL hydrolase family protein, partial [Acidimicrobiales bacterium]
AWAAANALARAGRGPLWVALGDSTGQGIGAATYDQGYVGGLLLWLTDRSRQPWRVVNLSRSGARAADVLAEQVPALEEVAGVARPALVSLAVGANDMARRTPLSRLLPTLDALFDRLPVPAVVATLPQGLGRRRPPVVNAFIRERAPAGGHRVADVWARTGPPWSGKFSADGFHPNEVGYQDWVAAFVEAIGEPPATVPP